MKEENTLMTLQLSKKELGLLKKCADSMGLNQSAYLRLLIRSCQITVLPKK
jgi:hypothetical protein